MIAPSRRFSIFRRFRRHRGASAAIEFALVAPLFLGLLFAILETSMVFFAGQILETGTQDSARMLFTHQAQDSNWTQTDFNNDLCSRLNALFDCTQIFSDVRSFPAGTPITLSNPINGSGNFDSSGLVYQPSGGGSSNVVVVRIFYQWPLFVTQLGYNIADIMRGTNNSKKLLTATSAFRVEPGT